MSEMDLHESDAAAGTDPPVVPGDAPEADALEQAQDVGTGDGVRGGGEWTGEADPADRADQQREVALDEDDYR